MRTLFRILLLAVTAACAARSPSRAPDPTHARHLPGLQGMDYAAQVTPGLYRGAQPDDSGYRALRALGIETVISFRRHTDTRREAEAAGLEYVAIPIHASLGSEPPTDAQLAQFFAVVLDPAKQPVFIHCKHGVDRTGMFAALFRIERQGWTNDRAIAEMQAFGFHGIFRDLLAYVRDYERRGFAPPSETTRHSP